MALKSIFSILIYLLYYRNTTRLYCFVRENVVSCGLCVTLFELSKIQDYCIDEENINVDKYLPNPRFELSWDKGLSFFYE